MVKVFALLPRRPDVTEEFFHEHWAGPHAELAKRITTLRRYVQSHRVAGELPGLPEAAYEGIAEVWFDDVRTAAGMAEDPNYANHAHLDEPNFIDTANLAFLIAEEEVLRAGPPMARDDGCVKASLLLRRRGGTVPGELLGGIRHVTGGFAAPLSEARRITVSTAVPEMYAEDGEPAYDAVVELWFADVAALEAAWDRAVVARLEAVADLERSAGFLGEELRVIWPEDVPAAI